ncbi:MAG TPA: ATP-binding protein [Vicinamibacterales bacterium]|nr:ATP-binding protein [Vicinamibacterales bacterium]
MTSFRRLGAGRQISRPFEWAAWLLTAAIFVVDLYEPAGYAIPLLYTPVLLLTLWAPHRRIAPAIAVVATGLTLVEFIAFRAENDVSAGLFNRLLAILVLWVTAGGVTMYRQTLERERRSVKSLEDTKYALDQAAIVATTDTDGRITYANDKFCEISKYSRQELLGRTHRIINSGLHPPEFFAHLWTTISTGTVWRGEIRNRAKDGSFYWVDTTIVPFLDTRGLPYQYIAIRYDITERKKSEAALRAQTSLAQLGKMAAVVAHEVRNPLAAMRGALQVLSGRQTATNEDRAVLGDVVGRIDALSDIVHDLLLFARPRDPVVRTVSLAALVSETVDLLRTDPQFAGVTTQVELADVTCHADPEQLRLVLLNLFVNSVQAMHGQGRIRVTAAPVPKGLELRIADEGPGLNQEARERLFEPFFTTKHRGTGLGLVTARRILESHNGTLELESPPHGGTVAILTLPEPAG